MATSKKKAARKKGAAVAKKGEVQPVAATTAPALFEDFDRLFEDFFRRRLRPFRWDMPTWSDLLAPFEGKTPQMDVVDRDKDLLVRAELPGVDRKDLDVSLSENTVTIKATTSREEKEEEGDYYRREISRGSYVRTVALPADVDGSKAKATFKDGVLELTLPKVGTSKRRKVKID